MISTNWHATRTSIHSVRAWFLAWKRSSLPPTASFQGKIKREDEKARRHYNRGLHIFPFPLNYHFYPRPLKIGQRPTFACRKRFPVAGIQYQRFSRISPIGDIRRDIDCFCSHFSFFFLFLTWTLIFNSKIFCARTIFSIKCQDHVAQPFRTVTNTVKLFR